MRHTQLVAVLRLELILQVLARKQVSPEPVKIGELLVWQLVQIFIRACGEAGPNEILQIEPGVGPLFASAGHVAGQVKGFAVAVVGADEVGVGDPAVVNGLAGLHGGLQLLHHIALADQVMLDLDASDLFKRLGQRF